LREAVDAMHTLANQELPNGIGFLMLDKAAEIDENSHGVYITYIVALVIVLLLFVAQFDSVVSAAIVPLTVLFGICAAILLLGLSGIIINIYSQIGVLMLIVIMAKNAILMVEFADQQREDWLTGREAAHQAAVVRLRTIAMTMISTVLANLPLVLGTGPGAEAHAAIGWVVVGGLGLASAFTPLLTPALYVLVAPLSNPRSAARQMLYR
jgi:HAE1 family hydrophobic/amphiphilic exporter-1